MSLTDKLAYKLEQNEPLTDDDRRMAAKIIRAFGQAYYAETGCMFICGASSSGKDGLPEIINVCPSYGLDVRETGIYMRKRP